MSTNIDDSISNVSSESSKDTHRQGLKSLLPQKWKEAVFLFSVTGISAIVGFSRAVSNAKKNEAKAFEKLPVRTAVQLHNEATNLAFRALKWGTFYAVCGTGLIAFTVWSLLGVSSMEEFRMKVGNFLPRLSKPPDQQEGRTEFENITDLFQYIIDEDEKEKKRKASVVHEKSDEIKVLR